MTEQEQRDLVVATARTWLGTPYHHNGNVKGVGVDCAMFILETFVEAGLEERFTVGRYAHDWHMHRSDEKYLSVVESYMQRTDPSEEPLRQRPEFSALPGDVLVFRVGRTYSHGAIVTAWPFVIHANYPDRSVTEVNVRGGRMERCPVRSYSYWRNK